MKSNANKTFWRDPWFVWAFPKRDRTIVYNAKTKEYDFYKGIPWEKERIKETIAKNKHSETELNKWKRLSMYFAVSTGVSLGIIVAYFLGTIS